MSRSRRRQLQELKRVCVIAKRLAKHCGHPYRSLQTRRNLDDGTLQKIIEREGKLNEHFTVFPKEGENK